MVPMVVKTLLVIKISNLKEIT